MSRVLGLRSDEESSLLGGDGSLIGVGLQATSRGGASPRPAEERSDRPRRNNATTGARQSSSTDKGPKYRPPGK